ncbi:MAG: hypothetical protein AUH32_07085 [Actinobacteria bacterium 13_1_40CM_66_12]|nr:MAG: hypothetical protein AUH32_07085 [Actinobacteria bacterium 13_1_40CM_66_12]
MPSVCTPGGSNSRTISWPCRALERQWMRRSGSPGRYSRAPNISFPEPARGAAMLASSSLTFCRSANALNRGKTATNSKSTFGPRRRKNPSGSPLSVVHPLAATGPRRSGPSSRNSVQPSFGTRPAAADNSLPPTDPKMRPGPRVPCFDSISYRRTLTAFGAHDPQPATQPAVPPGIGERRDNQREDPVGEQEQPGDL